MPDSRRLLDEFFVAKGPVARQEVPWPLDPVVVLGYLIERLTIRRFSFAESARVVEIVDAYLLRAFVPAAKKVLLRAERTGDDVSWSAYILAAMGIVADGEDAKFAAEYYEHLLTRPESRPVIRALLPARDALGPAITSTTLAAAMTERAKALELSPDFADGVEGRELRELRDNGLQEIDWADAARKRVNAAAKPEDRVRLLADIYFERADDGGWSYLLPWTVRRIRSMVHFGERAAVISAFQAEAKKAPRDGEKAEDAVRALHALEYFGVELEHDDREFLAEHADVHADPISIGGQTPHRWFEGHD